MAASVTTEDQTVEDTNGIRVFVYGTLKNGHGNHYLLEDAEYLGRCVVRGKFHMVDLTYYPGVVRRDGDVQPILGEVYRVDEQQLAALDMLEGHPNFYRREKVETPFKKAWMYFLPEEYTARPAMLAGMWRPDEEEEDFYDEAINA
jgi:gamma-glutamylaminecyclotransferase